MRALLIVLNGAGVGGDPDAAKYRDEGADTLGHLFEHQPQLELPALFSLGLGQIMGGKTRAAAPSASHGRMRAGSPGRDTTTGHWEIAGVVSRESFATFEKFPDTLVHAIEDAAKTTFLGNDAHLDGTILKELGTEHLATGKPILGVSPGSVMRIYAHEEAVSRARLHEICRIARKHCDTHRISRVVAQPFTGKAGNFQTGAAPHIYPTVPPRTILNAISETGLHVDTVGDVAPMFARSGITRHHPAGSDAEALDAVARIWDLRNDGLVFASLCGVGDEGRSRNPREFAAALQNFDRWLWTFLQKTEPDDLVIITADHGCDPTFPGNRHTREEVPLLVKHGEKGESLGTRLTFADVAATLGAYFHLRESWRVGAPFMMFARPRYVPRRY